MVRSAVPLTLAPRASQPRGVTPHVLTGPTMGVSWNVKLFGPERLDVALAGMQVQAVLDRVVAQMSPWESWSAISRFNAAAPGERIPLPAEFFFVLRRALHWAQKSDGAFDPTLGKLVDLWGFGPPGAVTSPPDPDASAAAFAAAGWRRLALDEASRSAIQPGDLALDLSGIAKGFGVDEAARVLERLGVYDYLIEIGGELRGAGVKPDGQPWWVEIETPPGAVLDGGPIRLALHGLSVATSGTYRRFMDDEGGRLPHTLDPRSGAPVRNAVNSVSVIHASCMDADALATVLGVLGPGAGLDFAVRHQLAAQFILEDGREVLSPGMADILG